MENLIKKKFFYVIVVPYAYQASKHAKSSRQKETQNQH